jgi:hypothetical protein
MATRERGSVLGLLERGLEQGVVRTSLHGADASIRGSGVSTTSNRLAALAISRRVARSFGREGVRVGHPCRRLAPVWTVAENIFSDDAQARRQRLISTPVLEIRHVLAALVLVLAACSIDTNSPMNLRAGESDTDSESETGEPEPDTDFVATCTDALLHRAPIHLHGSLRPIVDAITFDVPPIGLDCGLAEGAPIGFVRIEIPIRADVRIHTRGIEVLPRLAVLQAGCASEALDPDRLLACADALPVTIEDLRGGTELLLAIGAAPDDPALSTPPPEPGVLDPLEVEIEIELRAVIDEGQRCNPGLGRCETGTTCLAAIEDTIAIDRCRRPPADSCANPSTLDLLPLGESLLVSIDTADPHGDAHAHACTGWRRPERVHRLRLPAEISPTARVEIIADDPRVGLAVRMPDCLPEHAHACMPADLEAGPHTLLVGEGQLATWAMQGIAPLLFIELPADEEPPTMIDVSLTIIEP